jgi:spore maturation protein CgeB
MNASGLRLVVLGLSLSSSWGNGHATTYRALLKGLAARGHDILFLERNAPWYADNRDLTRPGYCRLAFYDSLAELRRFASEVAEADAVIVGSYVPQGKAVIGWLLDTARGVRAFYDIDTPVTLAALAAGRCDYLSADQVREFELYLSFTGGPLLRHLVSHYRAQAAVALYCSVDIENYRPQRQGKRWDIGYLGTYSRDRQPALERLLLEPARRQPALRCVIAGAQYPANLRLPSNVVHVPHLPPDQHPRFYSSLRWALNITRAEMVRTGFSPSVRLFEAAACATPLLSDRWPGLSELLAPGREIMLADGTEETLAAMALPERERRRIGQAGRRRILHEHTAQHRAAELEGQLLAALECRRRRHRGKRARALQQTEPKQNTYVSTVKVLT